MVSWGMRTLVLLAMGTLALLAQALHGRTLFGG